MQNYFNNWKQLKSGFRRTISFNLLSSKSKNKNGKTFFDQAINSELKTYENIRKIATGKRDDYTTGWLLDYSYSKEHYKMIAIDLSKQQAPDADPRAIQQINFTANLDRAGNTTMFFIVEEAKETVLDFSQGTVKVCKYNWMWLSSLTFINIKWHNTTV